jgi:ribosomal protein S18 acetylase RimI-like enzyme
MKTNELDNPVWHALSHVQSDLGALGKLSACCDPTVGPFAAVRDAEEAAFAELAALTKPDRQLALVSAKPVALPPAWRKIHAETLEQFVCERLDGPQPAEAPVELSAADIPAMLTLTAATQPGPFSSGTARFGRYIGYRAVETGALIAMAGERLRTSSATEISAVCTAADQRGKGLGGKLVRVLAAAVLASGKIPFLHVRTANKPAIGLYEALGFRHRHTMNLTIVQMSDRAG